MVRARTVRGDDFKRKSIGNARDGMSYDRPFLEHYDPLSFHVLDIK